MSPYALFRTFATAEVFTWAGLITALILRATGVTDGAVRIAGGIHGFVFLTYCAVTIFVWINQKWRKRTGVLGLVLAIVPFATLPFELSISKKGLLEGGWRLLPGGEAPKGFFEHAQALVLRRPIIAILGILVLVVALFSVLLWLGPPQLPGS